MPISTVQILKYVQQRYQLYSRWVPLFFRLLFRLQVFRSITFLINFDLFNLIRERAYLQPNLNLIIARNECLSSAPKNRTDHVYIQ